ncbi:putative IclR-family regulatory protein (plasmid) [Aromatoleum aromaticum EbN1]|uniref:IclR-family regulatory protein n=1 Tax=Aromatoleum aromaticum (strain DSM 19018 / LMG 30748 / EbN1) TaxID=76114 RepID=Q5NWG6_AROAE|nr:IclR family transcriptional regulator [Aromatoleum aromaticum]CAI10598.1 putative IclR-family regulatory protein [Aromatoleum aromaticum EbN1]
MSDSNSPGTGTQSIQRAAHVLRILASRNGTGLRLVDISSHSRLERPTAHRILKCLIAEGLVKQDAQTRRYFLGHLVFELGLAASSSFNLRDVCRPVLARLAEKTGDTVFLTIRSGFDTVCIDRAEGSFPIRTLTLDVGTRRPLGVGAGGLALLMSLPDQAIDDVVSANALRLGAYNNLTVPALMRLLKRCRELGYALNDARITPGATSVGLPIRSRSGEPFLAISVGAISSRMTDERQKELVALIRAEIINLEAAVSDTARP